MVITSFFNASLAQVSDEQTVQLEIVQNELNLFLVALSLAKT